jgi:hypothetical protein
MRTAILNANALANVVCTELPAVHDAALRFTANRRGGLKGKSFSQLHIFATDRVALVVAT